MGSKKGYICVSITVDGWWYQFLGVISSESVLTVGFPLSAPVLSWLFTAQGKSEDIPCPAAIAMRESTIHLGASSSVCLATALEQGPLYPTLRANPFPKVTDLFCRLPLPTLYYWPEATNLGDLMRLWVRPGEQIKLSLGFSRTSSSTSDTSKDKVLCPSTNPITR